MVVVVDGAVVDGVVSTGSATVVSVVVVGAVVVSVVVVSTDVEVVDEVEVDVDVAAEFVESGSIVGGVVSAGPGSLSACAEVEVGRAVVVGSWPVDSTDVV